MNYREIPDFEDRSIWLLWRHGGIGSSDASVIMDVSRFKSREELRVEKSKPFTNEDQANSYIKDRGNRIETLVRSILEDKHQVKYPKMNCESVEFPFMRASLDGINIENKTLVEIKLLSVFDPDKPNTETAGYKKWEAARAGKIPDEYYPQIQHQLMVTGLQKCLFVGLKDIKKHDILHENLAIVEVLRDEDYIRQLAKKEFEFWWQVQERK